MKSQTRNADYVLSEGGRIVIVGGGPGGTACALALQRISAKMGRSLKITVLEGKQFSNETHYNQCVGVLSPPLPEILEKELDVKFPYELCQVQIEGYVVHSKNGQITLDSKEEVSYAMRRVQFDAYMLEEVVQRGISVIPARAVDLEFHDDHVLVFSENTSLRADVVVGAFGLDDGSTSMFARTTPYRPPKVLNSIVTKYNPGSESMDNFGSHIHAFLPRHPKIEFGAVTPKCSHLTINIAGKKVDTQLMDSFLNQLDIRSTIPKIRHNNPVSRDEKNYFKGRFPRSLARNYYGDRYVMVGDASGLVRAFKGKGATTAMMTGIRAAETILNYGVSWQAFHNHYRIDNQDIIKDIPYGRMMRFITINLTRFGLMDAVLQAAEHSPNLRSALYEAVSGHALFKTVLKKSLMPESVWAVLQELTHISPN